MRSTSGLPALGLFLLVASAGCEEQPGGADAAAEDAADAPMPIIDAPDAGDADADADADGLPAPDVSDTAADAPEVSDSVADAPDGAAACAIPCLVALDDACPQEGACIEEMGRARRYANNVVITARSFGISNSGMSGEVEYHKPDGTRCYSVSTGFRGVTAENPAHTMRWLDASCTEVGRGQVDLTTRKLTMSCIGSATVYDEDAVRSCSAGQAAFQMWFMIQLPPPPTPCGSGGADAGLALCIVPDALEAK